MSNMDINIEFDDELREALIEAPEEEIIKKTNPWKKPIIMLLVGIVLISFQINIWHLATISTAIGQILMLMGFCRLRKENKYFGAGFVLAALMIIFSLTNIVLNTSIYTKNIISYEPESILVFALVAAGVLRVGLFCGGIREIYRKNDKEDGIRANLSLFIWYVVLAVAAYTNTRFEWEAEVDGLFILFWIILVGSFLAIIVAEKKFIDRLDDNVGYYVRVAKPTVLHGVLVLVFLVATIGGAVAGYKYGHSYEMDFHPAEAASSQTEEIRANLVKLGMPESVEADIQDEDIVKCEGATKIFIDDCSVHDDSVINATCYMVEINGGEEYVNYMYYSWKKGMDCFGTNALDVDSTDDFIQEEETSGLVMYDIDGHTMVSKYASREETQREGFFDTYSVERFSFSFEKGGSNYRGYTVERYLLKDNLEEYTNYAVTPWYGFVHEKNIYSYPAVEAKDVYLNEKFYCEQFGSVIWLVEDEDHYD